MPIRSSVVVGCDNCEVEGIPDTTTIPKGWINFSHRDVEHIVKTYHFCCYDCMVAKVEGIMEIRKRKLRRSSGQSLKEPLVYDEWPEEWAEKIEQRAQEIAIERQRQAQARMLTPQNHDPNNPPIPPLH